MRLESEVRGPWRAGRPAGGGLYRRRHGLSRTKLSHLRRSFKQPGVVAVGLAAESLELLLNLLHLGAEPAGLADARVRVGFHALAEALRLPGDLRQARLQVGPLLRPHLFPDRRQVTAEAIDRVLRLLLRRPLRRGHGRAR